MQGDVAVMGLIAGNWFMVFVIGLSSKEVNRRSSTGLIFLKVFKITWTIILLREKS